MTNDITFVCCIESGMLEPGTVTLARSLRKHGGAQKDARLVAVTPRFGPPLRPETLKALKELDVEHLRIEPTERSRQYAWNPYLNKPNAILAVDRIAKTEAVSWLDSDLLIVDDLAPCQLPPGVSFMACTPDAIGATSDAGDAMAPYWKAVGASIGVDVETLPWVTTFHEKKSVRYYFNSGFFVYRRDTGFAQTYLDHCIDILDARLSSKVTGFFFTDQVALGLTAHKMQLPWRSLDPRFNYGMSFRTHDEWYAEADLRNAAIVHYHDSLSMPFYPTFLDCLQATHPQAAAWVREEGAARNQAGFLAKVMGKTLRYVRRREWDRFGNAATVL